MPSLGDPSDGRAARAPRAGKAAPGEHPRPPPAFRRPLDEGSRAQGAGDGRGAEGEFRASGTADGHGRRGDRPLREAPEVRCEHAVLAGPRPLRAVGRARVDAALRPLVPDRLQPHDDRRDQAVPPARLAHRGPSRVRARARDRDDDGAARPGARERRRHGDRRGEPCRPLRAQGRRPPHLGHRRRRLPDGGDQPRGDRPRREAAAEPADRDVGRQRHLDRRQGQPRRRHRPEGALRGRRLVGARVRRPRSGRYRPGAQRCEGVATGRR